MKEYCLGLVVLTSHSTTQENDQRLLASPVGTLVKLLSGVLGRRRHLVMGLVSFADSAGNGSGESL